MIVLVTVHPKLEEKRQSRKRRPGRQASSSALDMMRRQMEAVKTAATADVKLAQGSDARHRLAAPVVIPRQSFPGAIVPTGPAGWGP